MKRADAELGLQPKGGLCLFGVRVQNSPCLRLGLFRSLLVLMGLCCW